jgi:hypothetical protein
MERAACALWQRATRHAPLDRHGRGCVHHGLSGIADSFNGHIDDFRTVHVQRSDGWIATTWNNMSDPGAFAVAGTEEQEGGESPPLAGGSPFRYGDIGSR